MDTWPIIMISVLILSLIILIITIWFKKKKLKQKGAVDPDYRAFYIIGLSFFPMGLIMSVTVDNPGFYGITAMGIVFLIIGLAHKDEWRK